MRFEPVGTNEQIKELASMANEIWHEYWPALIGDAQTDYMVEKFQSYEALARDIGSGEYEYWFLVDDLEDDRIVGYTGGRVERDTRRMFISKIYLYAQERGKGYASRVVRFYERLCTMRDLDAMYLTVNKDNNLAIRAYEAKGFETIEAAETDIGGGFVMDDFIMEKKVERD